MIFLLNSSYVVFVLDEPRMLECFIDSDALLGVLDQSLFDKILAFVTDILPAISSEVRL